MLNQEKSYSKNTISFPTVFLAFVAICLLGISSSVFASSADMYYSMGEDYMVKGSFDMAILAFENVVKLSPDWAEAHNALGEAYTKLLRFDDAVTEFEKAIKIKPDYLEAEKNHRRAMISLDRYKPMKTSRIRRWHKIAIIGGITATIAVISAIIVLSTS